MSPWGARFGVADPLSNGQSQFVSLHFQLPHPLHLDGEVATEFCDLAFDRSPHLGDARPSASAWRATYECGLGHSILSQCVL